MKPYTPEQLAAISRYQNYIPTLPPEIRQELYARMGELIEEEKAYCDNEARVFKKKEGITWDCFEIM